MKYHAITLIGACVGLMMTVHAATVATHKWTLNDGSYITETGDSCTCYDKDHHEISLGPCISKLGHLPCSETSKRHVRSIHSNDVVRRAFNTFESLGCACLDMSFGAVPMQDCYDHHGAIVC
ncbi:uncharacterized protein LOC135498041 [Lineus longissimus]|uniref:uncharacterized protein LOC135498041 n=1 Tax=Lineus longissimus TaxID=88925 RepID=UPI00315D455A